MRLRAIVFAIAAFGTVGAAAWGAGTLVADFAEDRAEARLRAAWDAAGLDWPIARADGLVIRLGGEAPDETARFHSLEIARHALDLGRIEDRVRVVHADPGEPPAFGLELLRSGEEVSLIGLVPAEGARETIAAGLAASGIGATIADMLETAAHPAPEGWAQALGYALAVLPDLPRAKIQVGPGAVAVTAVAADDAERAALAHRLEEEAPAGVDVTLDLTAPRPVIAPFGLSFRIGPDGAARLAACHSETEEDAAAILAAARVAGADEEAGCSLGLGAPSPDWAAAAAAGIEAVAAIGAGSFGLNDLDALLVVPPEIGSEALDAAASRLEAALPPPYALAIRGGTGEDGDQVGEGQEAEFRAVLLGDGSVRLAGPLSDRSSQIAVIGFAQALFGHDRVMNTTVLDPRLPEGWPGRVLAGIEALSLLAEGSLAVTAESLSIAGRSLQEEAGIEIDSFLARRPAAGPAIVDVVFDAEAAAEIAEAERPAREVCAEEIQEILAGEMILFEPGSATIDPESLDVVEAIGTALRGCPEARFEVSGHTDAQGSRAGNQRLSERRAEAVVEAVGTLGAALEPVGYGPDRPLADNDTEEGRALNRRIEFALLEAEDTAQAEDAAQADAAQAEDVPEEDPDGSD